MKVLLVNLEQSSTEVVQHHLELDGYQPLSSAAPEEAWQLLVLESPGALIVETASMNDAAWEFVERVRAEGRFHTIPLVVITRTMDPTVLERVEGHNAQVVVKPFSVSALLDKLNLAIRKTPPHIKGHVTLNAVDVEILLDVYRINGTVHLAPEAKRFSDAWESLMRDNREFIPLTHATVTTIEGGREVATSELLEIRKDQIRTVKIEGVT